MSLAWVSVAALVIAITLSCTTRINVGVVSLAFAWIVGVYLGHLPLGDILAGFPTQLFITLVGITLLFAMAQVNGTLARIAERAVRLCRGNVGLIPIMFFVVALGLATIGPGNIATAALLAPTAMAVAAEAGVPPFLMALMVGNGAQAGALSPFAPTGVIVNGIMGRIGLGGAQWQTYLNNMAAHAVLAFAGYFVFGGWRLFMKDRRSSAGPAAPLEAFEWRHRLTLAVVVGLIVAVAGFNTNVGMTAIAGATFLSLAQAADEKDAIRRMPWGVILMVSGVTVLIALMEKTQGMELFTSLLARVATPGNVIAVIAFVIGVVSVYSSTSGVVLPAFLPTVPGLVARLGGVSPLALASAMNVGAHLVDMSPLSTTGAICLAAAPTGVDTRDLFNKLLAWGLSMSVVGALVCWVMFR
ncbi:MAG: C4-dicarboxylate ABC transporter [Acidobacteria bacterium]|nr:C4-dicarboxylate ABC transporter [Acidobacteriota bacterium]